MTKKVLVIGAGQFGSALALQLVEQKADVTVLDPREDRITLLAPRVAKVIIGNATDEQLLRGLELSRFDEVVNAIGEESLEASIVTTQLLGEFGAGHVIARVVSPLHERIVTALGAVSTIHPERHSALHVARRIVRPELREVLELVEGVALIEIDVPERWLGKTLLALGLRARFGVTVVAVQTGDDDNRKLVPSPPPDAPLERGDQLMVIGPSEKIDEMVKELG